MRFMSAPDTVATLLLYVAILQFSSLAATAGKYPRIGDTVVFRYVGISSSSIMRFLVRILQ